MRRATGPTILHADLDAFYAAVEQRDDPLLRGRPVIVGSQVVLAASYEAKACGVRTAMPGSQARRACPSAVVVEPRMAAYAEASRAVFEVFDRTTPLVEALSIDEAFLDVGGLQRVVGAPGEVAARLRREVLAQVGLPITVGAASTKFLAKVASGLAKPDGLMVVAPGSEASFLDPLPVERLWGVGPVTAKTLHGRGIATVGALARTPEPVLVSALGPTTGRHLLALAHNHDPRPVQPGRRRRSIGVQRALHPSLSAPDELDAVLVGLVDEMAWRLRAAGRVGRTVMVRLRTTGLSLTTRSRTLPRATTGTRALLDCARGLFDSAHAGSRGQGVSLVGVAVDLDQGGGDQLALPFEGGGSSVALDVVLDEVRQRFGQGAVTRAVLLPTDAPRPTPQFSQPGGSGEAPT